MHELWAPINKCTRVIHVNNMHVHYMSHITSILGGWVFVEELLKFQSWIWLQWDFFVDVLVSLLAGQLPEPLDETCSCGFVVKEYWQYRTMGLLQVLCLRQLWFCPFSEQRLVGHLEWRDTTSEAFLLSGHQDSPPIFVKWFSIVQCVWRRAPYPPNQWFHPRYQTTHGRK